MSIDIERNGFSVHDGVVIVWDEDHDERILGLLDCVDTTGLLAASEHKGCLRLTWAGDVPAFWGARCDISIPDGDIWPVEHVVVSVRCGEFVG